MKFFNLDCHVSVIADIEYILNKLGHTVKKWSLSGHRQIFNTPGCPSRVITSSNWKQLDEEMVERFYKEHREELDQYDGFICTHHIHFLKLFEKFNKPIIVVASTRYEYPYTTDKVKLNWLEDSLKNNENIIKIANNEFDAKYCSKFIGNKWTWIPSLCEYTKSKHKSGHDKYIIHGLHKINFGSKCIHKDQLGYHTWDDLFSYNGIIHFPYNVSQMSIFEQDTAGVPLVFPTMEFAIKLSKENANYSRMNNGVFSQIAWQPLNAATNRAPEQFINKEWLSTCDFYNGTINCELFDNYKEIPDAFKRFKYSQKRNSDKRDIVYNKWERIIEGLK